jgi:hypothetical protein
MGFSTLFKYLGLAMEAAEEAASVLMKVKAVQNEDSPGGKEITTEEMAQLVESLDDNFSNIVTRICREVGLPIKSVTVTVDMED